MNRFWTEEEMEQDAARRAQEDAIRNADRYDAERAIVLGIVNLARKYNAVEDLLAIDDITIPALQELASSKGVSVEDWNELISILTPMKWQLEALVGATWAECWEDLKARFGGYVSEIINQESEE